MLDRREDPVNEGAPTASVPPTPAGRPLHPHKELFVAWTLLLIDSDDAHGYKLHDELVARGLDLQQPSTVYRLLHSFERDRWVTSSWGQSVAGPRRRLYVLTESGRETLLQMSALIAATRDTYSTFLRAHERAVALRVTAPSALDETALPAARDRAASVDDGPAGAAATLPAPPPLRPHKELLVGWLLLRLDAGPTYGYELRRELAARRLTPDPGTVYRMLRTLEADKWLQSRWLSPVAGPRRRFYRLTNRGRRTLDAIAVLIAAIRDLHDDYLREYDRVHRRGAATEGTDDGPTAA